MAKKRSSKNDQKNNFLYVIGAAVVIVLLLAVVIYYSGNQLAGKATANYADGVVDSGVLPVTLELLENEKEASFFLGDKEYTLSFTGIVDGVISGLGIDLVVDDTTGDGTTDGTTDGCTANSDCTTDGEECDTMTGLCVPITEPVNTCDNGFLDEGEECDDSHPGSFCTDCVCDEGYVADPDNSACMEEPANLCTEGNICDYGVGLLGVCQADGSCSACTNDPNNCPNGYNCFNHYCVEEPVDLCLGIEGQDGEICDAGICVVIPEACTEGVLCDYAVGQLGVCQADGSCSGCTNAPDNCPVDYICGADHFCVEDVPETCTVGDVCDLDGNLGVCQADGSCSGCTNAPDNCPNGYNCLDHYCVEEPKDIDLFFNEVGAGDVIVEDIMLTNIDICLGNLGTDSIEDSFVVRVESLYPDGEVYDSSNFVVNPLVDDLCDVGDELFNSVEVYEDILPTINLKIIIDYNDEIVETNEDNNEKIGEYTKTN